MVAYTHLSLSFQSNFSSQLWCASFWRRGRLCHASCHIVSCALSALSLPTLINCASPPLPCLLPYLKRSSRLPRCRLMRCNLAGSCRRYPEMQDRLPCAYKHPLPYKVSALSLRNRTFHSLSPSGHLGPGANARKLSSKISLPRNKPGRPCRVYGEVLYARMGG